jgi:HK97 family phage portal protein
MDIIKELSNIQNKEAQITDFSSVYYSKIAPAMKSTAYLETSVGWVYACCAAIADEIAKTEIKLFKKTKKGLEEIFEHPVLDVLYKANDFTTKFDLFWLIGEYLELTGEAPLFVIKQGNIPTQLFLLRPDKFNVLAGKNGVFISGYSYRNAEGKDISIDIDEMLFIKYPDPVNYFRGKGTLQAATRIVDIEQYSEEYNKNYFFNSATPSLAFTTEQKLSDNVRDRFRKQIEQNYKGLNNAHKFLIMEAGLDAKPLQLSQKDMDFINQLNWTRDKILGIFRVPRTVLGITDDVNRANAEATDYVFIKRNIYPKIKRIVEQLNEFFLPMFPDGDQLLLDFANPIPEDLTVKTNYYVQGLNNGWLTPNEVRQFEGLKILEDGTGNELSRPFSLQPIGEITPTKGVHLLNTRNKYASKDFISKEIENIIDDEVSEMRSEIVGIVKSGEEKRNKDITQFSRAKKEDIWNATIKKADNFESIFTKELNKQFNKQADEILKGKKKGVVESKWLLNIDKEKQIFFKVFLPIITEIVMKHGQDSLDDVISDETFKMNDAVKYFIDNKTIKFATEVNITTNDKIKKILADNYKENESIISKKIRDMFDDFSVSRSKMIARTETFKAVNFATEQSYIQSGVVEAKEWFTALDERVCEFCDALDGKTVSLGKSFFKRGDTVSGSDGGEFDADYETIQDPPLHANCRCSLAPVIVGQKEYKNIVDKKQKNRLEKQLEKINLRIEEQEKEFDTKIEKVKTEANDKINKTLDEVIESLEEKL